jgi:hypothetical protein
MEQGLILFNSQIVRGIRPDHLVLMRFSINAFTDELFQESGHRAACPVKSRL